MKKNIFILIALILLSYEATGQNQRPVQQTGTFMLSDIRWRDVCILPDQVTNGAVGYVQLKDDLSETAGEPVNLFRGSQVPWTKISDQYGCHVTDGPYLYKGKTGKLYMIWTSVGNEGMALGIAISESGKLAGLWKQQAEPVFKANGGHGMLFTTFEGKLMMVLHSPYNGDTRPHLFEMEDTGETLKVIRESTGNQI